MTSNIFVLLNILIIFYNKFIFCGSDDPSTPAVVENKLVFDLANFKNEDYTLHTTASEPYSYKVQAKGPKEISEVKLNNQSVWKSPDTFKVENVSYSTVNKNPLNYMVKIKDENSIDSFLYFKHGDPIRQLCVTEYICTTNSDIFSEYKNGSYMFNLASAFDHNYNLNSIVESANTNLKNITYNSKNEGFYDVRDNAIVIFNEANHLVSSIKISTVQGEGKLLDLRIVNKGGNRSSVKYFTKTNLVWNEIQQEEYDRLYAQLNFAESTRGVPQWIPEKITSLDISSSVKGPEYDVSYQMYATIPAIVHKFKNLKKLTEATLDIETEELFNTTVYVNKGTTSWEFVEIAHTVSETDLTRKLSLYYIRDSAKWNKVSQAAYFAKIRDQMALNLVKLSAAEDKIQSANKLGLEDKIEVELTYPLDEKHTLAEQKPPVVPPPDGKTPPDPALAGGSSPEDPKDPKGGKIDPPPTSLKKPKVLPGSKPGEAAGGNRGEQRAARHPKPKARGGSSTNTAAPKPDAEKAEKKKGGFCEASIVLVLLLSVLNFQL